MAVLLKPKNESSRVAALEHYHILNDLPEKEYDDITELASFICDTPIAFISLADGDKQWFKAKKGLSHLTELPREGTFCATVILQPHTPLLVEDATKDPRFADHPLVIGKPFIRFYAGFSLNTPSGHSLGTLCVMDSETKAITDRQVKALQTLANNVISALEVRRKTDECELLIDKLIDSTNDLERFAHTASHDLQEPIRMIRNFSDLLAEQYGASLDERALEYLQHSSSAAQNIQSMVNDLLEYSRSSQHIRSPRKVESKRVIAGVMNNLALYIAENEVTVEFPKEDISFIGNPIQITRLLQNLVGNAIKYKAKDRPSIIKISIEERPHNYLFCVSDNGIGMLPEYLETIFEPFERLHRKHEYSGSGMGLAICRKIVKNLGGEIWAKSELGEGCQFYFTLAKISG